MIAVTSGDKPAFRFGKRNKSSPLCPVSPRELECIRWASFGKSAEEMAEIMGTTPTAVRAALNRAGIKTGCYGRPALVGKALREGWIE